MQEQPDLQAIGPYRVERVLGRGGMGVVYAVRHPGSPALVALKTLEASAPGMARERFLREVQLLRRVDHPHVLGLLDAGQTPDGRVYLVTELVPGQTLRDQCKGAPLSPGQTLRVMRALCDAVRALHAQGILHRDLKPDNVILRPDGSPILLDFGIARADEVARLTKTGEVLGTPAFMSPEQVDGQGVDERADVYGLGAILFYLLSGRPPFDAPTAFALYRQVLFEAPEWPQPSAHLQGSPGSSSETRWSLTAAELELDPARLRAGLCEVCRRAMAKEPAQRHPSTSALAEALEVLASGGEVARAPRRKAPWALLAAGALGLGLAAWGASALLAPRAPTPSPGPDVDADAAAPQWSAAAIQALPPLADPSFPAALHALQASTPGERAAQARLQSAREGLEGWGTASDADLATWADGASDLPLRALGPLALLRPPTVAAFHHGSPLPPPADTSKLDDHLEDQAIQVAFCDPAGRRYVTVGHRTLKLWSWPATLEKSVALPASWTLTQCLVVQPQAERVFLGGRQEVPKPFDPGRIVRNAALASYALGNAEVELHEELSGVLQRDRVQALALHDDVLVCGTNKGYLTVFHARNTLELVARGELPDNVNARGLAFLDDPTHFYAASGDDSDPLYGLYRYRIEHALCELDATEVELEHPRRDLRVFTSLASCPPYGLYVGQSGEGTVVRYGAEQRKDVFVDPRCGRAHGRSAVALAAAPQRGWLVSASGWAEWEADDADDVVRGGRLPGEPATLCVWDLETSTLLGRFAGLHPQDGFSSVAVTPDGSRVLAGTACGDVLGWALE